MSQSALTAGPSSGTDNADRKRKAVESLPTRSKVARTESDYIHAPTSSDDELSDGFDAEDEDQDASGTTTPLTARSSKTNPNWASVQKTIPCTFPGCDKMFNRNAKLQDHLRSHTNDRPFACAETDCGKTFLRKTHLDRHVKSAHTEQRDYICAIEGCDKAFSTGTRLRRHEAQHAARNENRCSECGQEFRKQATLQRHIDTEHNGQKAFVCEVVSSDGTVCGVGFTKPHALKTHQSRTHNEKRYWCEVCMATNDPLIVPNTKLESTVSTEDFGFATYGEYQLHLREVHPPNCDLCDTICKTDKLLARHKELEHGIVVGEEKPMHPCPHPGCERSFSKKGNMDVHYRSVHAKKRPFVCGQVELSSLNNVEGWDGHDACAKDFKAKSQLEEHIRTAHLGLENRYKKKKQAKAAKASARNGLEATKSQSSVGILTGTGHIICPVTGCQSTFRKDEDCEVHLQVVHGFEASDEVEPSICSWNTEFDQQPLPTTLLAPEYDMEQHLEEAACRGRPFWLGAESVEAEAQTELKDDVDSFQHTRQEIGKLIGSGNGWEDDIIMDPKLLDN